MMFRHHRGILGEGPMAVEDSQTSSYQQDNERAIEEFEVKEGNESDRFVRLVNVDIENEHDRLSTLLNIHAVCTLY
ncbi:hypothetical protein PM082_015870 [Marasmius tenuissimus]|nr:hypothetical protein PM082_015870 [Marasmius tenuissimus]